MSPVSPSPRLRSGLGQAELQAGRERLLDVRKGVGMPPNPGVLLLRRVCPGDLILLQCGFLGAVCAGFLQNESTRGEQKSPDRDGNIYTSESFARTGKKSCPAHPGGAIQAVAPRSCCIPKFTQLHSRARLGPISFGNHSDLGLFSPPFFSQDEDLHFGPTPRQ